MQQLIDVITTAIASDASSEQKAAGVQACRTIAMALDTEPGKPLTLPGVATVQPASRLSLDQVLDLVIARLNVVATDRERTHAPAAPKLTESAVAQPAPRGLKIPLAPTNGLNLSARSATKPGSQRRAPGAPGAPHSARAPRSQSSRRS